MCVRAQGGDLLVAINSSLSYGRQRFTAAHELYHLYVQEEIQSVVCGMEIGAARDAEEQNADAFASYFLAPNDALRSYIENNLKGKSRPLTLEDVVRVEQHFRMSRQATLYRLVGDRFITLEFANTLKMNVIASARQLGFDAGLYLPTPAEQQYFTTGSYIELAQQLNERELVSTGKYEELLLDAYRADIVYNLVSEAQETYD